MKPDHEGNPRRQIASDHGTTLADNDSTVDVLYRPTRSITDPKARYPGFRPAVKTLLKGTVVKPKSRPLDCDIVFEQDVGVRLRDGTTIYIDVIRPAVAGTLPTVVCWSPYGKQSGVLILDDLPFRAGIPKTALSGLETFEGADPAYWCAHGYAVVNVDARGAFSSEGDIHWWGRQEGQDGYDLIEWIAEQSWSNGRVGLSGNSWLAIVQWFIAAEKPPHLAAIAPWEGWTDFFRCDVVRGGIPDPGFNEFMLRLMAGKNRIEDVPAMIRRYPLMNSYWEGKIARLENIEVPAYVVSSWTNLIHTYGTFTGFREIASKEKWLRVHNTHEWSDYYTNVEDLRCFFDHYLKGIENDWKSTPPVRLSVLDPGGVDIVNRPEAEFPMARTHYQPLYLDAQSRMLSTSPVDESKLDYVSDNGKDTVSFVHRFEQDTELTGYLKLKLWVEAPDSDDLDLFVEVRKLSRSGRHLLKRTIPFPNRLLAWTIERLHQLGLIKGGMVMFTGAKGQLRASQRQTDPQRSGPAEPYYTHRTVQKLIPGEIVPIEILIWPLGMLWHAGEQLQLIISGHKLSPPELPGVAPPELVNRGRHVIYTGGRYESHLLVPVIPDQQHGASQA